MTFLDVAALILLVLGIGFSALSWTRQSDRLLWAACACWLIGAAIVFAGLSAFAVVPLNGELPPS